MKSRLGLIVGITCQSEEIAHGVDHLIAGVALTDPSFAQVALELSKEGAAKPGIA
jgi:hypothetical protein